MRYTQSYEDIKLVTFRKESSTFRHQSYNLLVFIDLIKTYEIAKVISQSQLNNLSYQRKYVDETIDTFEPTNHLFLQSTINEQKYQNLLPRLQPLLPLDLVHYSKQSNRLSTTVAVIESALLYEFSVQRGVEMADHGAGHDIDS